jgi:hypothetical protein
MLDEDLSSVILSSEDGLNMMLDEDLSSVILNQGVVL